VDCFQVMLFLCCICFSPCCSCFCLCCSSCAVPRCRKCIREHVKQSTLLYNTIRLTLLYLLYTSFSNHSNSVLAVKTASKMTYTVLGGALNSTQSNPNSVYSSVHCRPQSISCCSCWSVEQSSITCHYCPLSHLKSHLFSLSYPSFRVFSHMHSARTVTRHFGHYSHYYI